MVGMTGVAELRSRFVADDSLSVSKMHRADPGMIRNPSSILQNNCTVLAIELETI